MYKVMLSAGEASGDLHGAGVAAALQKIAGTIYLFGMGGQAMRHAGVEICYDIADYGVMGFVEVIKNLPRMFKLRSDLVALMQRERPDILVIIDYPDFNLRLAKSAKQMGIPVFSYIPPSAWAWRKGRAKLVAGLADKIAAILPFETAVYRAAGADISFVGNPLLDIARPQLSVVKAQALFKIDAARPVILLLPGSRKQEISQLLPVMLAAAEKIHAEQPKIQFFLPLASTISGEIIHNLLKNYQVDVHLTQEYTYDLMNIADAAIAASGTVTLEAALLNLPVVVVYKMAPVTYFIARRWIDLPNVSLPNIIAGKRVIPELLQSEVNADKVKQEVMKLLRGNPEGERIRTELEGIKQTLGEPGAVDRVAALILKTIADSK